MHHDDGHLLQVVARGHTAAASTWTWHLWGGLRTCRGPRTRGRPCGCPLTGLPLPALKVSGLPLATEPTRGRCQAELTTAQQQQHITAPTRRRRHSISGDAACSRCTASASASTVSCGVGMACTHGRRITRGARAPGFCSCANACVSTACHRGSLGRYPHRHARMHTKYAAGSLACVRVSGPSP